MVWSDGGGLEMTRLRACRLTWKARVCALPSDVVGFRFSLTFMISGLLVAVFVHIFLFWRRCFRVDVMSLLPCLIHKFYCVKRFDTFYREQVQKIELSWWIVARITKGIRWSLWFLGGQCRVWVVLGCLELSESFRSSEIMVNWHDSG